MFIPPCVCSLVLHSQQCARGGFKTMVNVVARLKGLCPAPPFFLLCIDGIVAWQLHGHPCGGAEAAARLGCGLRRARLGGLAAHVIPGRGVMHIKLNKAGPVDPPPRRPQAERGVAYVSACRPGLPGRPHRARTASSPRAPSTTSPGVACSVTRSARVHT